MTSKHQAPPVWHYWLLSFFIIAVQIAVLLLLDRTWFCTCGYVTLWQGMPDPAQNSQQPIDPYSFMHVAFGSVLFIWLQAIRPTWPIYRRATYAVASSCIWEIAENLPFVIHLFGAQGSGLDYSGDSIVNSVGDTLAVILGFAVASRLPPIVVVSGIVLIEIATFFMIGDSILAGLLRVTTSLVA
ncbi:DUF2585 family protein [Neorhizobium sp. NPDC001467]|uniref:DUF2585 family protein n=1 Tax=Neorhizobium sp. NPDC001467 TaxID=3390595 RepID=UPI003D06E9A4